MNPARLLAAFALAFLLFWFATRAAHSQESTVSLADLLAAVEQCPEPRCPDPPPPGAIITLRPSSLDPIVVESRRGWSPTSGEVCQHASAYSMRGQLRSPTVELGFPPDCIPMPEPSGGLGVGLLALAVLGSRRLTR